jgi:hypothetical protein
MFASVNHNFSTAFHNGNRADLASGVARIRPVFHRELGRWLADERERLRRAEGDKWSLRNAATMAKRQGLPALSYQVLFRIERGQVRHITRDVLEAIAALYGLSYPDVLSKYIASEYGLQVAGSDLTSHAGTRASGLPRGGVDVSASTRQRIQDLEGEVAYYRTVIKQAQKLAARTLTALSNEGRQGAPTKSSRR